MLKFRIDRRLSGLNKTKNLVKTNITSPIYHFVCLFVCFSLAIHKLKLLPLIKEVC